PSPPPQPFPYTTLFRSQLEAFAEQPLGQLDHRAVAQVIGAGFEAEAENANLAAALVDHRLYGALDLQLVARQDRGQNGQRHIERFRLVQQCAQVLGQARAAESEAGPEVMRRQVELGVLAENLHHAVAVQLQGLAAVSDLVCKADLERVPGVVRVLDHFSGLDVGADQRRGKLRIQARKQVAARAGQLSDHGLRRIEVVVYRGCLAQKLGIRTHPEIGPGVPSGAGLQRWYHQLARGFRE